MSGRLILPPSVWQQGETCERCKWAVREGNDLVCRRMPPQLAMVIGPDEETGEPVLKTYAGFPPVQGWQFCGLFEAAAGR